MKEFFKKLGRKLTGRKGIGNTMTVVIIIAVVMLNVLAYTLTNAFGLYFYSPPKRDFSLSGSTDDLFSSAIEMKKKVTITFCYLEDKLEEHSTGSYVLNTAREFEKRYPELIELKFINLLTKMDEVLISEAEHHANLVPWQMLRDEIGFELLEYRYNKDLFLYFQDTLKYQQYL